MANVKCAICNKAFSIIPKRVKEKNYCSRACYSSARSNKKITYCAICGVEIHVKRSSVGKYCSRECASIGYIASGKMRKLRTCVVCGKEFMQAFFMDATCSTQCEIRHNKLKPLFQYNPENEEAEVVDNIHLRQICPFLGF